MSTGNYPPAGQPESAGHSVEPNPPAETPAHLDGTAPGYGTAAGTDGAQAPDSTPTTTPPPARAAADRPQVTRAGVVWAAVVAALVLLILLIIFILQNQDLVLVRYFGFEGSVPLGMALFIASVSGAVVVAVAGGARILQLRRNAHRARAAQRR
ncbi:putative integral membrane protein [Pseudarthrobacter sp. W1I19]|uniref:lipopolysaccharide assembly protein LapA domain-containing protein n=1 Tax=Pseudarthrobacter sp. W1I19 TaxID=3042288 RepID=UPI00277F0D7D|nr:lipopolysaccharide assembly protein LapA domain-containing protein [Pseudarthrobacter sp. W1I19]MDQ0925355.1 putative integral membrane protein [Pseudarthrobacter sp. W1I19]